MTALDFDLIGARLCADDPAADRTGSAAETLTLVPELVGPDSNAAALTAALMRQVEDRRLLAGIADRRFAGEALALAVEAFAHYDPKRHQLSHLGASQRQPGEVGYAQYFRSVAFDTFRRTRNIGLAATLLDRLIAEA